MPSGRVGVALSLLALVGLTGCFPLRYVTQAAAGQEQLNGRGVEIAEVVEKGYLDKRTRELLAHVPAIKAFGERHGLKHTSNYERYLWIGRPAVIWVVSACHPLRFRAKAWSYPIVGSITYTGWFDRKEADAYAAELRAQGWDVDVRGSQAYSTLGWFDDPILSTMISKDPDALGDLADTVLHETLHATFYVPGQSTLNESVASFFGDHLAMRYLDETVGPDSIEKAKFMQYRVRAEARGKKMRVAYDELTKLYASNLPKEQKLALKKEITEALRAEIQLRRPVTNATLIQYKTYGSGREEMGQLLEACGGDFTKMLRALERLKPAARKAKPHTDPAILLREVLAEGC
ncbi:MAG: aminopeptidase [Labilithrix sp.]|nr:aminopeptidase [Labilithrix sp.]